MLAALKYPGYLEYLPQLEIIYKNPPQLVDGMFQVSEKPGLGIDLDEAEIEKWVVS